MYEFLKIGGEDPKDAEPLSLAREEISAMIAPLRAEKALLSA
jgi:hypothetical protein